MIAHCFFEQSGTFKNEFKKLGIEAFDYDILNDFNETDFIIDLFNEIEKAYKGEKSIFDKITQDDLIIAFFPCTRFENQINLFFRGDAKQQKNHSDKQKIEYVLKLNEERTLFYEILCKFIVVCIDKKIKLIIENPYSNEHFLTRYFPIKPKIIDKDRTKEGDYYKKPTQYFFINCEPKQNFLFEPLEYIPGGKIEKVCNQVERSLISTQYASRFIRKHIIEERKKQ